MLTRKRHHIRAYSQTEQTGKLNSIKITESNRRKTENKTDNKPQTSRQNNKRESRPEALYMGVKQ